jgi:drug/metabolite transporter (DMT)-like permease
MLISVVGFALMNLVVKNLKHIPATELVLFRSIVSLVLSYIMIRKRKLNPFGNNKLFLVLRGVFGVTALTIFFHTLQELPIGSAITIQYLSPIFTVIFAIFFLKEKMQPIQWLFFLIAFAGIAVIKGFDPNITFRLLVLGITSAIFSGLAYNCIRKLKDTDHPVVVVFYFPLIATPIMLILSYFNFVMPIGWDWLLLLLMGILTQIAQIYMTKAYQHSQMDKTAPLKYLGIIFAIAFDVLIFGVVYTPLAYVGIALVIAGVVLNLLHKSIFKVR